MPRLSALVARARTEGLPVRPPLLTSPKDVARRRRGRLRMEVPPGALRTIGRFRKRLKRVRRLLTPAKKPAAQPVHHDRAEQSST